MSASLSEIWRWAKPSTRQDCAWNFAIFRSISPRVLASTAHRSSIFSGLPLANTVMPSPSRTTVVMLLVSDENGYVWSTVARSRRIR